MIYHELDGDKDFIHNRNELKKVYDVIGNDIDHTNGTIKNNGYIFNNFSGDITKNIKWTWCINKQSFELFNKCVKNLNDVINTNFNDNFILFGCSFITLFEKEVSETHFHLDVNSQYDTKDSSSILTLIFPLYISDGMGGLEFQYNNKVNVYNYNENKLFVWDACKLNHRTQPYSLPTKTRRVLVSLNYVNDSEWAKRSIYNTLKCQGNKTF